MKIDDGGTRTAGTVDEVRQIERDSGIKVLRDDVKQENPGHPVEDVDDAFPFEVEFLQDPEGY
jgi:hypothetical protein